MVRNRLGRYATGLLAAALMLACATGAAAQTGMVKGKVTDAQGNPVEGAKVTITQKGSKSGRELKTNKKGEFVQLGVFPGDYTIAAEKDDGKASIDMPVSMGENPDVSLRLSHAGPSPEAKAKADALQKAFEDGVAANKASNYDEAIAKFNEAAALVPACADCYYNIGVSYMQKKDFANAETAYKKAIEIKPDYCEGWSGLANVYNIEKKLDLALEAVGKATQCGGAGAAGAASGGNAGSLYNEGVILWNQNKYPEAKAKFEAAAKADPSNADAQYRLGMADLNLGDMPGASAAFEAYLKADPNGPHAAEVKGIIASIKK
jgi:tetratricopeptide (TPR) repeat protein